MSTIDTMHTNVLSEQVLNKNQGIGQARLCTRRSSEQSTRYGFRALTTK